MPGPEVAPTDVWLASLRARQGPGPAHAATDCVHLRGYPVLLGEAQSERSHELNRELRLLLIGRDRGDSNVPEPARLVALSEGLMTSFGGMLAGATVERQEALARGQERIDLRYPLDDGSREILLRYAQAMEEVDGYCRSGAVMTLPTPPAMVALRRWIVEEFVRQYDGLPPRPWKGPLY